MEAKKTAFPPLTRREFLNYAWLASLGFAFTAFLSALLSACRPFLPQKETEPIHSDYMWLGSSTIKNLGDRLTGNLDFPKGESSWFLRDTRINKTMFIHGKYGDEGAKIQDVLNWLDSDETRSYSPDHINILIGGNEITDYGRLDTDEKLQKEAIRIVNVVAKANTNFVGKKVHIILPFPTMIDLRYPNTVENYQYEHRRKIFNDTVIKAIYDATVSRKISNADYIIVDDVVYKDDPQNPGSKILDPSSFRDDGRHITIEAIDKMTNRVYSVIGR